MSHWMEVRRRLLMAALSSGIDVTALAISYTGNMTDEIVTMGDGKQYRLLTLTSSGTLTTEQPVVADIWLCGGGAKGGKAWTGGNSGGHGGSGGFIAKQTKFTLQNLSCIVGAAAGNSSVSGDTLLTANCGTVDDMYKEPTVPMGTSGGGGRGSSVSHRAGLRGTGENAYPFEDDTYFSGKPHCAGGGGGNYRESEYAVSLQYESKGGNGGSNGSNGKTGGTFDSSHFNKGPGLGGALGGGKGGNGTGSLKASAATFYGSGGGGGFVEEYEDDYGDRTDTISNPSNGYQGVIYVRIPLDQRAA